MKLRVYCIAAADLVRSAHWETPRLLRDARRRKKQSEKRARRMPGRKMKHTNGSAAKWSAEKPILITLRMSSSPQYVPAIENLISNAIHELFDSVWILLIESIKTRIIVSRKPAENNISKEKFCEYFVPITLCIALVTWKGPEVTAKMTTSAMDARWSPSAARRLSTTSDRVAAFSSATRCRLSARKRYTAAALNTLAKKSGTGYVKMDQANAYHRSAADEGFV